MATLTWKFTVIPTQQQEKVLQELSETCRLQHNHALAERKYLYDTYNYCVTYREQQNALPQLKKRFPRYRQVYSKILQMTLKKLDAAYISFFGLRKSGDHTTRPPTFRGKDYFFTLCYNQSGFKITKQTIHFSRKHPSKPELILSVPFDFSTYVIKQIEIFQNHNDKRFYLAVAFEHEDPPLMDNGLYQAFDLGTTKHTAINLHGKVLESTVKRPDKYWELKIRSLQQRRVHCQQGSRKYCLFSQRLASIKRKCRNQTRSWQHKQSLNLLRNIKACTIIVGDLSPKQMSGKKNSMIKRERKKYQKNVNRGIHSTGHLGRFIELMTYKAQKLGKRVTEIDEWETTKTCSVFGHMKKWMSLSERIYHCEVCEIVRDRDQNSTISIMKRVLSCNALWTDYRYFLNCIDNQRYPVNDKTKIPLHLVGDGFSELVGSPLL